MSGKQHQRELRRQREAARAAARAEQRRKTIQTGVVIAAVLVIGGVLVAYSLDRPETQVVQEPSEVPVADVTPSDPAAQPGQAVVGAVPTVVRGDVPVACGAAQPANAAAPRPTFPGGPAGVLEAGPDYRAVMQTSCGRVVIDLAERESPISVNSFVFLARQKFFDGIEIFRNATTIGALQTGSGTNQAAWDIGYRIRDELSSASLGGYAPGAVAMANAGPNTGGSQFFFVYNDNFQLPANYAKFGTVVEGLDVLQRIGAIAVSGQGGETPTERVYIDSVTIEAVPAPG
ncbi:MAG: peptidylprolyl isomerase [Egibacteraceae bacterium]